MLLNSVPVGAGLVPDQTRLSFAAAGELITAGWQTIGLRAHHLNDAHFTITDHFALHMNVSYPGSVCQPIRDDVEQMSGNDPVCG